MTSDWDEIKRLAADFQKVQLTSSLQKLSERNCIEIVTLLVEKGLVDVIFTNDGKEYITPEELRREIEDELVVRGGRVNLVELSKTLNVDLSKVNTVAERVAAECENIHFMLGQLIDEDYIIRIASEINEKLAQAGEISISDLTVHFDLPSDFLQHNVVEKNLGKIIKGRQDPSNSRVFFTQSYIMRCRAKIRGALAAITRPTPVATILQQIRVQDRIFHSVFDEIAPAGTLTSKLQSAQYIPHIYSKMQNDWVNSFYKQNGFLEYESITKLGLSDPQQFIKKQFQGENITYLKRCAVGPKITELTVMSAITECSNTKSYVDLSTILPSILSDEDIDELFTTIVPSNLQSNFVLLGTTAFSSPYLNELIEKCKGIANVNAKASVESGAYQTYLAERQLGSSRNTEMDDFTDTKTERREERRKKAATGKAGGGAQGRETKTKSVKKHQRGGDKGHRGDDSDDEVVSNKKGKQQNLILITTQEIEKVIFNQLEEEGLDDLCGQIAQLYHAQLNQFAVQTAQALHEASPQTNRRQTHAALQEKLNTLLVDLRLYERGLKFLGADVQPQLVKYLLKSLGNDVCNEIALYIANECNLNFKSTTLTPEQRTKIVQECAPEYKASLTDINKTVAGGSVEDFLVAAEGALKACSMIVKKIDKKKDKALIVQHKEKLCQQLNEASDPALILHLAVLIIYTSATNNILHASGRHVSQILRFLQPQLNSEQSKILTNFHDSVLKLLNSGPDSDEGKLISEELKVQQKDVCNLAVSYEKPGVTRAE